MIYDQFNNEWWPNMDRSWLIIGPSRVGKSSLAHNIVREQIDNGRGVAVLDPHGNLIDDLMRCIPRWRVKDSEPKVIWFEPESVAMNLCEYAPDAPLKIEHTVDAFAGIFDMPTESVRLLRHCLIVHSYVEESHIGDVLRMLRDKRYRHLVVAQCLNEETRDFWEEFETWEKTPRFLAENTNPVKVAIETLLAHPAVKKMLCQYKSTVDFGTVMDKGQILFAPILRGKYGDSISSMLGSLVIAKFRSAAFEKVRPSYQLVIDEVWLFAAAKVVASMLSGTAGFGLTLGLILQYGNQSKEIVEAAVENCETVMAYHPLEGVFDAKFFEGMPYRTLGFKMREHKFTAKSDDKWIPSLAERLLLNANPLKIKDHSKLWYRPVDFA